MILPNGVANIVAAAIVGGALVYNGAAGRAEPGATLGDKEFAEMYARAVGDIRNDIVVNCGCCGEEGGAAVDRPF
jgi:hypothetical protein